MQWNELRKKLTRLIMFRRNNMPSKNKHLFGLGYIGLVINLILLFIGIFTSLLIFNAIAWVIVGLSVNFFDHVIRNSKSSKRNSAHCSSALHRIFGGNVAVERVEEEAHQIDHVSTK